jgi:hypothetical protein
MGVLPQNGGSTKSVALYLTVRDGTTFESRIVLATSDPALIAKVGEFLADRLGGKRRIRRNRARFPNFLTLHTASCRDSELRDPEGGR